MIGIRREFNLLLLREFCPNFGVFSTLLEVISCYKVEGIYYHVPHLFTPKRIQMSPPLSNKLYEELGASCRGQVYLRDDPG
jgi:hypothetical protein